jgi:ppGpp synthetase/RelA/SpoT-type nucleotidyltranferase
MFNFEEEAKKWMKVNNIEITKERLITLSSLLAKFENQAHNVGLNADKWR